MTTVVGTDRTYIQLRDGLAWHAKVDGPSPLPVCKARGRSAWWTYRAIVDRVPSAGHLCSRCARVIAARTDYEPEGVEG